MRGKRFVDSVAPYTILALAVVLLAAPAAASMNTGGLERGRTALARGGAESGRAPAVLPAVQVGLAEVDGRTPEWPMHLFVDSISGNDDPSCTREGKRCRTIQAAIDRIPAVLGGDAIIHILPGDYEGDLRLMDRLCPLGSTITLRGETILTFAPGVTEGAVILGDGLAKTGITVERACAVTLENLTIRGFVGNGVALVNTPMVRIVSTLIDTNGGHGLSVEDAKAEIYQSVITSNAGDGISCDRSHLRIGNSVLASWPGGGRFGTFRADTGQDDPVSPVGVGAYRAAMAQMPTGGVVIAGNGSDGLNSLGCEAIFGGWAIVSENALGLRTDHGGVIDFAMRPDIMVKGNTAGQLEARCHGMIEGYIHAMIGGACESCFYGVCRPE